MAQLVSAVQKALSGQIVERMAELILPIRDDLDGVQAALNGPVGSSGAAMGPNIRSFINNTPLRSEGVYGDPVLHMLQQSAINADAFGRFFAHVAAHPTEANLASAASAAVQLQRQGKVLAAATELARTCNEPGVKDHPHLVAAVVWEDLSLQIFDPEEKVASGHKQLGAIDANKRKVLLERARTWIPAPAALHSAAASAPAMGSYMPTEPVAWQGGLMGYPPTYMPLQPHSAGHRSNSWTRDQHAGGPSKKAKTGPGN
jgi:hypothetical protein